MKERCIFCGSNNTEQIEEIHSSLNQKLYRLYQCYNCHIQFILPNVYEDVYTDGVGNNESMNDYVKELHRGRTIIEPPTKELIKQLKRLKIDLTDKKILDIGAGDGINYLGLKENFNINADNYYAIECDPKSLEICKKRGLKNIFTEYFSTKSIAKFPQDFDLVIFTEVFEHQTDPADFIEAVKMVLKPGGFVILTVPNRKMFSISRAVFYADIPPHHFLRLDSKFFAENFNDFNKINISVYPNPFMILNKDRACRKISSVVFRTEMLGRVIRPFFGLIYLAWKLILRIRGNGIVVVLSKPNPDRLRKQNA